jgi:hypothetical protein
MTAWMPLWLFPVGLLGGVALVSLGSIPGYLLAALWGLVVFPHGSAWFARRWRGRNGDDSLCDDDTDYWRFTPR